MDEGLSIGIASQPFFDIPGVLRQDGSPPLYYMLLHVWMDVFGNGPAETQGLSVAISLLAVPGGLWAGWTLFGRRAGPDLRRARRRSTRSSPSYAQETRMYSLMVVLSLLATRRLPARLRLPPPQLPAAVRGAARGDALHPQLGHLRHGRARWSPSLSCCAAQRRPRARCSRTALIGFGAALSCSTCRGCPTLLYQAAHTGAPWLNSPRFGAPVQISKSLLGGGTVTVALVLAAGSGLAAVLAARAPTSASARRSTPRSRSASPRSRSPGCSRRSRPAWTTRYLGVALGPIFLLASRRASRAPATSAWSRW